MPQVGFFRMTKNEEFWCRRRTDGGGGVGRVKVFLLYYGDVSVRLCTQNGSWCYVSHPSSKYHLGIHCISCSEDSAKSMQLVVMASTAVASMTVCQFPMPVVRLQSVVQHGIRKPSSNSTVPIV